MARILLRCWYMMFMMTTQCMFETPYTQAVQYVVLKQQQCMRAVTNATQRLSLIHNDRLKNHIKTEDTVTSSLLEQDVRDLKFIQTNTLKELETNIMKLKNQQGLHHVPLYFTTLAMASIIGPLLLYSYADDAPPSTLNTSLKTLGKIISYAMIGGALILLSSYTYKIGILDEALIEKYL